MNEFLFQKKFQNTAESDTDTSSCVAGSSGTDVDTSSAGFRPKSGPASTFSSTGRIHSIKNDQQQLQSPSDSNSNLTLGTCCTCYSEVKRNHCSSVTPSPQSQFQLSPTPERILRKYIQNHETLDEFDEDTAFEICQGAAALCFMTADIQVGASSSSPASESKSTSTPATDASNSDASQSDHEYCSEEDEPQCGRTRRNLKRFRVPSSRFDNQNGVPTSSSSAKKKSRSYLHKNPTINRLSLPSDKGKVNSLHCFVRSELLEIFTVSGMASDSEVHNVVVEAEHDDERGFTSSISSRRSTRAKRIVTSTSSVKNTTTISNGKDVSSSTRLFPGRVGFRCTFCSKVPQVEQQTMAAFHPKRLTDLYRSVCTWQRVHFQKCSHIPQHVREKYRFLKDSDRKRGKTAYWVESARQIGLVNVKGCHGKGGISFQLPTCD